MDIYVTGWDGKIGHRLMERGIKDHTLIPLIADIKDKESIRKALPSKGEFVLLNLAAITSVLVCEEDYQEAFNVNVLGAMNLLDCTRGTYVYFSTSHVFSSKWFLPTEKTVPLPENNYGISKLSGESIILRPKYDMEKSDRYVVRSCRVFDDLEIAQIASAEAPLDSPAFIQRSFIHVDHFIEEFVRWFTTDRVHHERIVHIGTNERWSYYDYHRFIFDAFGRDLADINRRGHSLPDYTPRPFRGGLKSIVWKPQFRMIDGINLAHDRL